MKKLILLLIAVMAFLPEIKATHLMGGEIRYQQLSQDSTIVFVLLYRDTRGIPQPDSIQVKATLDSISATYNFHRNSVDTITNSCAPFLVERHTFIDTISTLQASFLEFNLTFCCRNAAITNIAFPNSQSLYLSSAKFTDTVFSANVNNSPVMSTFSAFFLPANQSTTLDFGAIDPDGDSLFYKLGQPHTAGNKPIPYIYNNSPIDGSFQLDSATGLATIYANTAQTAVVKVIIEEYRTTPQGTFKIGETFRDVQIHFVGNNNAIPEMTGIDSTQQTSILAVAGDTVAFSLYATDTNASDSLSWFWLPDIPDATITVTTSQRPVLSFEWITDSSDVQFAPHLQHISVRDNNCFFTGEDNRTFIISVLPDSSAFVWPGDTDNDLVANVLDILPIGLAYGAQGPVRANATTAWTGQASIPWNTTFWNGLDYKFADADGNGTIDSADADVVYLNYGQTHQKVGAMTGDDIRVYIDGGEVLPGTAAALVIEAPQPISDFYGLAMEVNLPSGLIANSNLQWDNSNSFLGSDVLQSAELINGGAQLALAITGTDQQNRSGSGELARLTFDAGTSLQAGDSLSLSFSQFKAIDAQGADKNYGVESQDFSVSTPTGSYSPAPEVSIWPNPTAQSFFIKSSTAVEVVRILDITGRVVYTHQQVNTPHVTLPTHVSPGVYWVEAITALQERVVVPLLVQ